MSNNNLGPYSAYHPQCSILDFEEHYLKEASLEYTLKGEYIEEVVKEYGMPGFIMAAVCFIVALIFILLSCLLCCIKHEWKHTSELMKIFSSDTSICRRLIAIFFVVAIASISGIIMAVSIWGITKTEMKVKGAMSETFDFIERTADKFDKIYIELSDAVDNGSNLIKAVDEVIVELENDDSLDTSEFEDTLKDIKEGTSEAKESLELINIELEGNIKDSLDIFNESIEYRDEAEQIENIIRILVICCFVTFIFLALLSAIFTIIGNSPKCSYFWAVLMWIILIFAFGLGVGILNISKEVSKDTCINIDTFAVTKISEALSSDDSARYEELLWYYFQEPGKGNLTLAELEVLWDLPLTELNDFLVIIEKELFTDSGELKFPATIVSDSTQDALEEVYELIPEMKLSIEDIQDLISGNDIQTIHKELKEILCCTLHDAIDVVWKAWTVSSVFGFFLTLLVQWQVLSSLECCIKEKNTSTQTSSTKPESAYMRPTSQGNDIPIQSGVPMTYGYKVEDGKRKPLYPNIVPSYKFVIISSICV